MLAGMARRSCEQRHRTDGLADAAAPEAAGVIHTDVQRGFIKAETVSYEDFIACGGEQGARDAGKMRQEG